MDFFYAQDQARRKTKLLVLYFLGALVLMNAAVYAGVVFVLWQIQPDQAFQWWNPHLFLSVSIGVVGIVGCGSIYKLMALRSGGGAIARSLGGRPVTSSSTDPLERRLLNVVDEMAIASGTAVPEVFIFDDEAGINALAAGDDSANAVIAVTRGALEKLSRDELQGVIAHEFAHILNGDMRVNIRIAGVLFGLFLLSVTGRILLRVSARSSSRRTSGRSNRTSGGSGLIALGMIIAIAGYFGYLFGRLIQAAVSRQREFLADAAAVQFTRNPLGISGALQRIGATESNGVIRHGSAAGLAHLFFANAIRSRFTNILATHPPLADRIRAVDPSWDGRFQSQNNVSDSKQQADEHKGGTFSSPQGFPSVAENVINASILLNTIGQVDASHVHRAREFLNQLPTQLRQADSDPVRAQAIIAAMLLNDDPDVRQKQTIAIRAMMDEPFQKELDSVEPLVSALPRTAKLPLMEHVLPALRGVSERLLSPYLDLINGLIAADRHMSLFEFALEHIVRKRVFAQEAKAAVVDRTTQAKAISTILSLVVSLGADSDSDAKAKIIFLKSVRGLNLGEDVSWEVPGEDRLMKLDNALDVLDQSPISLRHRFLEACARAIAEDRTISADEAELFRVIAINVRIPVPMIWARDLR